MNLFLFYFIFLSFYLFMYLFLFIYLFFFLGGGGWGVGSTSIFHIRIPSQKKKGNASGTTPQVPEKVISDETILFKLALRCISF